MMFRKMMFRKMTAAVICLAATATVISGAVQSAEAPAQAAKPPAINACSLLTDAEVAAAVGAKVSPGERMDSGAGEGTPDSPVYSATCLWRIVSDKPVANDPNLPMGGISFAILNAMQWKVGSDHSKKFIESFFDAAKSGVIDNTPVKLKLANDAIWWGDGVAVRKGDRSFGISVHVPGEKAKEQAREESLAKKILPRI